MSQISVPLVLTPGLTEEQEINEMAERKKLDSLDKVKEDVKKSFEKLAL